MEGDDLDEARSIRYRSDRVTDGGMDICVYRTEPYPEMGCLGALIFVHEFIAPSFLTCPNSLACHIFVMRGALDVQDCFEQNPLVMPIPS